MTKGKKMNGESVNNESVEKRIQKLWEKHHLLNDEITVAEAHNKCAAALKEKLKEINDEIEFLCDLHKI